MSKLLVELNPEVLEAIESCVEYAAINEEEDFREWYLESSDWEDHYASEDEIDWDDLPDEAYDGHILGDIRKVNQWLETIKTED